MCYPCATMSDDDAESPRPNRLAVLAIGGNALLPRNEPGTMAQQQRAARKVAGCVVALAREGTRVLVVHGNGPQVGRELVRNEEATTKLPPRPLDACVAATQGTMGYLLSTAIRNALRSSGMRREVAVLLSEVLVSAGDPAFDEPTKPVGPFHTMWRARELMRTRNVKMIEDAGRGWRQVVASPRPVDILGLEAIEALLGLDHIVVAGGGGGVPVAVDARGTMRGLEGVIDKDRTAALMANNLGADLLVVLTPVDHVYVNFGQTDQRALERVGREEVRALLDAGHFPPGSMGPKIEAALDFLDDGGSTVIITSPQRLVAALADRAGTRIVRDDEPTAVRRQLMLFPTDDADESEDLDPDD
jgi:carbamate kinase